jgi:pantoate--beta-alanine ligase
MWNEMDLPLTFSCASDLRKYLEAERSTGNKIGFVPTMGALHSGHLELVNEAFLENDRVVVSIFVNPTQFNNSTDLEKYPRTLDKDLKLLAAFHNVIVFHPTVEEVYPSDDDYEPIDLEGLDEVMEGTFRPGHFQGVVHVVRNLFNIVEPDNAYFGLKDFQQLAIIKLMVQKHGFKVRIVACETVREESGLAKSSRNLRLSDQDQQNALIIYQTLQMVREKFSSYTPEQIKQEAINYFNEGELQLEYLEIVDPKSLRKIENWEGGAVCCIAAYCQEVRLIDNMILC